MDREAFLGAVRRDEDAVVLQKHDGGWMSVLPGVAVDGCLDRGGEGPTRVGVGNPQRRRLIGARQLDQRFFAGSAGQGVDRHGVGMNDYLAQESVQGTLDRRPPRADGGRGQVVGDGGFAIVNRHGGEFGPVEDGQDPGDVHLHPAGGRAHRGKRGTAGLDSHGPAVRRLDGCIATARPDILRVRADSVRYPNELQYRFFVHSCESHSVSTTVLMPWPASTTA